MKLALCLILLLILIGRAQAQEIQTFPLDKEITEPFFGCIYQKDAVEVIQAVMKGKDEFDKVTSTKIRGDLCRDVVFTVIYREPVFEVTYEADYYTVYRGTVRNKDIFVPMRGYRGIWSGI